MILKRANLAQGYCLALILTLIIWGQHNVQAEGTECRVNDYKTGWWRRIMTNAPCIFPGERHHESPWVRKPLNASLVERPYRIEGKYRMSVSMTAIGFSKFPAPEENQCITGYAEAYTEASCELYQYWCDNTSGQCHTVYTASGTLCTAHYIAPPGNDIFNYGRYLEYGIIIDEWVCYKPEPAEKNSNLGFGCSL